MSQPKHFCTRPGLFLFLGLALLLASITFVEAKVDLAEVEFQRLLKDEVKTIKGLPVEKVMVFLFLSPECPISNRYAPELRKLHQKYLRNGVTFWAVYPNPGDTAELIRKHSAEYEMDFNLARDHKQSLRNASFVTKTPEAAVFLAGQLVYHGRIDNRFPALNKERPATEHNLDQVLSAVIAGKKPPYFTRPVIGCHIENAEKTK